MLRKYCRTKNCLIYVAIVFIRFLEFKMLSPEEYILDFKAEEKRTHSTVFDIEDIESDSSTISASEVNSNACNTPTPPLLHKLRKARVMIKKLPRHVLEKYDLNSNKSSIRFAD